MSTATPTPTFILPPKTPAIVKEILAYHRERVMQWLMQWLHPDIKAPTDAQKSVRRIHCVKNDNTKWVPETSTLTLNVYYLDELMKHLMTEHIQHDIVTRMAVRKIDAQTSIIGVYAIRDIPKDTFPFKTLLGHCFAENPVIKLNKNTPEIQKVRSFLDEFFLGVTDYPLPVLGPNSINVSYFLNHSDTPNVALVATPECFYTVYQTIQPIKSGEELTINYNDFVSKKMPFYTLQKQLDPTQSYLTPRPSTKRHRT